MQASSSKRSFRRSDDGVSEVIGQILTMGISSILLITALWGFAAAKDNTTERAVTIRGDALIQQISSTAIQAALFAEDHAGSDFEYVGTIDLPSELEGHQYTIDLDPDEVIVTFPNFNTNVSAPLFQAGAGTDITICDQQPFFGGRLNLILKTEGSLDPSHECYVASSTTLVLYLEIL